MLREFGDESLKRCVRLSEFLFAPLSFSEEQVGVTGRRAVWVAVDHLLIFLGSFRARQRSRCRRCASIGIVTVTSKTDDSEQDDNEHRDDLFPEAL